MGTSDMPDAAPAAAPKVAPESVALRASPRPVTRLNRRMLAVDAGTLAAAVLGGTLWSLQSSKRERNPATELFNVDRVSRAENLDKLPKDYAGLPSTLKHAPPVLGEPLPGDLGPAIVKAQQPMEMRPPGGGVDPAQAERLAAEEAARSSVFFRSSGSNAGPKPGAAQAAADPSALASGNQPFNPMGTIATAAQPSDPTAVQNRQDQKEAFIAKSGDTATRNPGSLQLPASPYQVMAGTIIPAALVTGINSDLPGQVIANVSEAVYDTATGRHLLISQGSRLIGRYDSQVAFGQRRVLLGVDAADPAGHIVRSIGSSARHRPCRLRWARRWRRLALGPNPGRRCAVHSVRYRRGAGGAGEPHRWQPNRRCRARERPGDSEPSRAGDHEAQHEHPADADDPAGLSDAGNGEQGLGAAAVSATVLPAGIVAMSAAKLRLGPLPKATTVRLAVTMPADLKDMLDRYAAQHSQAYGEPVDAASLIPHMLEAFMARDRAFSRGAGKRPPPQTTIRPGTLQQVLDRCRLLHDEGINSCSAISVTGLP